MNNQYICNYFADIDFCIQRMEYAVAVADVGSGRFNRIRLYIPP